MNTKYIIGPVINLVVSGLLIYFSWKFVKLFEYYYDTKINKKETR